MSPARTIAVVGGGFAGTLTAIHLIRSAAMIAEMRVVLINRTATIGPGVAYSVSSPALLLNVPAARMSALPDDPDHFLRWARTRLGPAVAGDAFLPRGLYGAYLSELFEDACGRAARGALRCVRAAAIDVEADSQPVVTLSDGQRVAAERVVMARGHSLPRHPPVAAGTEFYRSRRYLRTPWSSAGLDAVERDADVLLIGSGLTMYDVVLLLRERGHRGTILVLSRSGLMPRCHAPRPLALRGGPSAQAWLRIPPTAGSLLRAVRAAAASTAEPTDWRAVIDSLRPVTAALWQRLPAREQQRFVLRLRPYWEVHRHRAAVEVHRRISALVADGLLRLHRGQVRAWREDGAGVTAELGGGTGLRVGYVVNCTGPDTDVQRSDDPLVRSLLARGLIVRDRLGLGIETAADGAVIDAGGRASSWLYTLGTWRKPALWESVAVPELRIQAADLAQRLTHDLPADALPVQDGRRYAFSCRGGVPGRQHDWNG